MRWLRLLVAATGAALLLSASSAYPSASDGLPTEFRPSLPVFGGGKFVNFFDSSEASTNAAAHVGFSLAIPLLGEHFWGRKGLWISGLSWMGFTLLQESLFHAPENPGPGYPAEVRSDLITRLVPCATLLLIDALAGGHRAAQAPGMPVPPERPGMPWPITLDFPSPLDQGKLDRSRLASVGEAILLVKPSATQERVDEDEEASAFPSEAEPQTVRTLPWSDSSQRDSGATLLCTASLLFQGGPACAWVTGRPAEPRQVAER